jgi:hypothetical protein
VLAVGVGNTVEFFDFLTISFFAIQIGHCFFPQSETALPSLRCRQANGNVARHRTRTGCGKDKTVTGTYRQSVSSSATAWRVALLLLAIVLGLTNLVVLAATFRPDYWDRFGLIGIIGTPVNGKLRVSPDITRAHGYAGACLSSESTSSCFHIVSTLIQC